jgi:hypothetical protein
MLNLAARIDTNRLSTCGDYRFGHVSADCVDARPEAFMHSHDERLRGD